MIGAASHLQLPPERFYWGLLDTSNLTRKHLTRKQLDFLFEPLLPVPLDQVHATYASGGDGRIIACAADVQDLESLMHSGRVRLTPVAVPEILGLPEFNTDSLNLLTGPLEPKAVRAARASIVAQIILFMIALTALLIFGLERRLSQRESEIDDFQSATDSIYVDLLGEQALRSPQPPAMQLLAERRRLDQTRSDAAVSSTSIALVDAVPDLEALLQRWPNETHLMTELISITPTAITVRGSLPPGEVERATRSMQAWGGWRRAQPEVSSQQGASILTLRFDRALVEGIR